jgi:hypothetical protein
MNKIFIFTLLSFIISCSPKVRMDIKKKYNPLNKNDVVQVYGLNEQIPNEYEDLGEMKVGDSGFTRDCQYEVIIKTAKKEARNIGGNAIKITDHAPGKYVNSPDYKVNICDEISAKILRIKNGKNGEVKTSKKYALLHFYRLGTGIIDLDLDFLGYKLHLNDSVIASARNCSWRKTVKIKKPGKYNLWAMTETKQIVPIEIELGKEYYIQCGLTYGIVSGRPSIEVVDNEYGSLLFKERQFSDTPVLIVLNSGIVVEGKIKSETQNEIRVSTYEKKKKKTIKIDKSQVNKIFNDDL